MTPEDKARIKIDRMFEEAGWQVVDRDFYSPTITAAAIREGLLDCKPNQLTCKEEQLNLPKSVNLFQVRSQKNCTNQIKPLFL